jgi:hypothetical protein
MCDVNSCNAFLLLFMALWVPISATIFRRAMLTGGLLHAFLFLGPRASGLLSFSSLLLRFAWWPPLLLLVRMFLLCKSTIVI